MSEVKEPEACSEGIIDDIKEDLKLMNLEFLADISLEIGKSEKRDKLRVPVEKAVEWIYDNMECGDDKEMVSYIETISNITVSDLRTRYAVMSNVKEKVKEIIETWEERGWWTKHTT